MKRIIFFIFLVSIITFFIQAENGDVLLPNTDFSFHPLDGIYPEIDFSKLCAAELYGGAIYIKQLIGSNYTYIQMLSDFKPFDTLIWPYLSNGAYNGNVLYDSQSYSNAMDTSWNLTIYQGIYTDPGRPLKLNILNWYAGYYGYSSCYQQNPDSYYFNSSRNTSPTWYANILKSGFLFDNVDFNRLINTKKGDQAQIQVEWAPRAFGNDIHGITDFTRLTGYLNQYFSILENKDFSLYLFQQAAFDIAWGSSIPVGAQYGLAEPIQTGGTFGTAVRGTILYDGLMHAVSKLDLRCSFPTVFESGMMPGFLVFWDAGLYDNYDYRFATDRVVSSMGGAFLVHLDSASLIPYSAIMDVQLGVAYNLVKAVPSLYFEMFLPQ